MPDDWEDEHALNKLDSADAQLDPDADRLTNYGEYLASTDPHDPESYFALEITNDGDTAFALLYPTVSNRTYHIESTGLLASNTWSSEAIIPGTGDTQIWFEPPTTPSKFFRIKITPSSEQQGKSI